MTIDIGTERRWPLYGYAPGDYMCCCADCGETFTGDKRAWNCLPCAERRDAAEKAAGAEYWGDLAAIIGSKP